MTHERKDYTNTGFSFFLKLRLFKKSFRFPAKRRGRAKDFPYTPCPHTCIGFPINSGTFVIIGELILTCPNHTIMVYIKAHSWCCTFCGFGQTCNEIYRSLWYHTEQFYCPKNPLCSAYSSLPL